MKRLGVLGGSFDPLHLGHLWIATLAREQLDLETVLFVPAGAPPHKSGGTFAPYAFRLALVRRALDSLEGMVASDLESDAAHASYTVSTLRRLRSQLAVDDELWLLLGADSLADLPRWRDPEAILELARLAVYGRPGHAHAPAPMPGATIRWIEGPECGLSSTWIRERLRAGRSVAGMVPPAILPMIEAASWYARA